ncbi:MAG: 1-acyl-sn-glycerol-3-phosphate acyltransferase [Treponema sp.]|nr:1-acyl-sn-glycerol-3-phosphate acyltransferase [Treponema sp.]
MKASVAGNPETPVDPPPLPPARKASNFSFFWIRFFVRPAIFLMYRFRFDYQSSRGIRRPCFILSNHQAVYDQFAAGIGFPFGINFVASDTIFRHGLGSRLMTAISRPIPFSKGSSDFRAVKNMLDIIRDGGAVAMFPSGNRSFYGDECRIVPGIGRLAKKFAVPLVLVRLEGGYGTLPRWKAKPNRGKASGGVARVVSVGELERLSGEEVDRIIWQELGHDEFARNAAARIPFRGKRRAEYLESVLFYCPECGAFKAAGRLVSEGNRFSCLDCGAQVGIDEFGFFRRERNAGRIPETILEWSKLQLAHVRGFDFRPFVSVPAFADEGVSLFLAQKARKEHPLGRGRIELFADRLRVCGRDFPPADTTMAVQGVRKLTLYLKGEGGKTETYAVTCPFRTCLMKYMICGWHLRNRALGIKEEYYGY